jgi:hypothetical protein
MLDKRQEYICVKFRIFQKPVSYIHDKNVPQVKQQLSSGAPTDSMT